MRLRLDDGVKGLGKRLGQEDEVGTGRRGWDRKTALELGDVGCRELP
ncbi:hypothetical protein N483_03615 [Pseudoalteromonas luteoviolacea NCIMB 1944]|nr:hypothetical protein N483_03615 [Pseudoalteromonas luteoviolacea NCIMB 1944]